MKPKLHSGFRSILGLSAPAIYTFRDIQVENVENQKREKRKRKKVIGMKSTFVLQSGRKKLSVCDTCFHEEEEQLGKNNPKIFGR